jgi:hypothetical protein
MGITSGPCKAELCVDSILVKPGPKAFFKITHVLYFQNFPWYWQLDDTGQLLAMYCTNRVSWDKTDSRCFKRVMHFEMITFFKSLPSFLLPWYLVGNSLCDPIKFMESPPVYYARSVRRRAATLKIMAQDFTHCWNFSKHFLFRRTNFC